MSTNENLLIGQSENGTMQFGADDKKQNEIIFEYNGIIQDIDGTQPGAKAPETGFGSSIFQRFRDDLKFRHRLLHTACVGWSMVALGWRVSLIGPTFPDLRLIMDEDLSTASWLFTAWALGGLVGAVVGGAVYDKFNKIAVYITLTFGLAATGAITPWSSSFPVMFVLHLLGGGFGSAIDAVGTTDIVHVWRHQGGSYMQAVHFGFSIGAIVSPFIAGPFLAPKIAVFRPEMNDLISLATSENRTSTLEPTHSSAIAADRETGLKLTGGNLNISLDLNQMLTDNLHPPTFVYGDTLIYIPYSISSCVSVSAMISFVILYCAYGNLYTYALVSPVPKTPCEKVHENKPLSTQLKILFILLQSGIFLLYFIIEKTFIGYLMTFLLGIGWSKPEGASATSVMWIAFASGRFSGIFIVKFMTQTAIIFSFIGILALGIVGLWIAVAFDVSILIWTAIAVFGLGMSIMFASIFSWLSENVVKLTGKITSILFIIGAVGTMLFPLLTGSLMSRVSYQWYIYLVLILVSTKAVLFTVIICVYKFTTGNNLR